LRVYQMEVVKWHRGPFGYKEVAARRCCRRNSGAVCMAMPQGCGVCLPCCVETITNVGLNAC
jgi:hypothetical protein